MLAVGHGYRCDRHHAEPSPGAPAAWMTRGLAPTPARRAARCADRWPDATAAAGPTGHLELIAAASGGSGPPQQPNATEKENDAHEANGLFRTIMPAVSAFVHSHRRARSRHMADRQPPASGGRHEHHPGRLRRRGIGGADWGRWGAQDDADRSRRSSSVERGINWIDTAAVYGLGHSEEVAHRRGRHPGGRPALCVYEVRVVWDRRTDPRNRPGCAGLPACAGCGVRCGACRSSESTSCSCTGRRMWHAGSMSTAGAGWTCDEAGPCGRSVDHSVAQLDSAEKVGHVDSLQPPFSAINRTVGDAELPWCADHETAVIVYSPMQSGC